MTLPAPSIPVRRRTVVAWTSVAVGLAVASLIAMGACFTFALRLALLLDGGAFGPTVLSAVLAVLFATAMLICGIVTVSVRSGDHRALRRAVEGAGFGYVDVKRLFAGETVPSSSGHALRVERTRDERGDRMTVWTVPGVAYAGAPHTRPLPR